MTTFCTITWIYFHCLYKSILLFQPMNIRIDVDKTGCNLCRIHWWFVDCGTRVNYLQPGSFAVSKFFIAAEWAIQKICSAWTKLDIFYNEIIYIYKTRVPQSTNHQWIRHELQLVLSTSILMFIGWNNKICLYSQCK